MGGTTYTINTSSAQGVQMEMVAVTKLLQEALETLDSEAQKALQEWTGEAQTAYAQAKQKWDAAAAAMAKTLGYSSETLDNITVAYQRNDASTAQYWS